MAFDWTDIFDEFGSKRVTPTDKNKGAYVLNEAQKTALANAGIHPSGTEPKKVITIEILLDPQVSSVRASYYDSLRRGSGRTPESRMGQGLIQWAGVGDEIVLGVKGGKVMAAKANALPDEVADLGRTLAHNGNIDKISRKAAQAVGQPAKKIRKVNDFVRSPYVVAAALLRAAGTCEMPRCIHELFQRDDGSPFLEVHHIIPLGEGGDDTIMNAVALCPACHRELHFGSNRARKRTILAACVSAKPLP